MPPSVHGGGTKRARVGWGGDDIAVQDMDLGGVDAFNASEWPVGGSVGGGGAAAEGGESEDGSPPRLCLPTGNVIDDGTFCPDDELFLHARPPVRTLKPTSDWLHASDISLFPLLPFLFSTFVLVSFTRRLRICCGRCTATRRVTLWPAVALGGVRAAGRSGCGWIYRRCQRCSLVRRWSVRDNPARTPAGNRARHQHQRYAWPTLTLSVSLSDS